MKTNLKNQKEQIMKKLIAATAMLMLVTSTANAGNFWFNPDGTLSPGAKKILDRGPPAVGSVPFRELKEPDYQSRTTITSDYGTSVYTFRSYSR